MYAEKIYNCESVSPVANYTWVNFQLDAESFVKVATVSSNPFTNLDQNSLAKPI